MVPQEIHEVQQREMQSPAHGKEQSHALVRVVWRCLMGLGTGRE